MKKLSLICMSALLMLAVSCKKDKKTEVENAGSGFRATVESHEGAGKTHLEGLAVKWNSGDAILVKSSTCTTPKRFTTTGTDASANFDAAESLPENFYTPNYTGYYPADKFSGDQLTLPPTQQYDENNTFASGANPMAATSSETLLPFKNVCGVLKLQLYSATACQVQSISITSNNDEQLCGTGAVTLTGGVPALGTLSNGGSTLTLLMGEGGKAMSTSESAPTAYYFVVPVGTLGTSFTVKVTETNGNVWSKTATATQNTIARSQITVMPKQAVETEPDIPEPSIPEGALPGLFSVSATKKVYFSKGNLQYRAKGGSGGNAIATAASGKNVGGTWRFAEHQYDYVGDATHGNVYEGGVKCDNAKAAWNYTGWIDLFGWGTSGYNHGATCYQPWSTSTTDNQYYAYGAYNKNLEGGPTQHKGKADWGKANAISNGTGSSWRTLTGGEWDYLINGRTKAFQLYGLGEVDCNEGLIILPDEWTLPTGLTFLPGVDDGIDNVYTYSQWSQMEAAGAVFLPFTGNRYNTTIYGTNPDDDEKQCYYWSSSYYDNDFAFTLYFLRAGYNGFIDTSDGDYRCYGNPVRLVSDN